LSGDGFGSLFSVVSIEKTPFLFKVAVFRLQLGLMLLSQHVLHSYLPKKLYPCGGSTVIRRLDQYIGVQEIYGRKKTDRKQDF
jgi:hypothetical protein